LQSKLRNTQYAIDTPAFVVDADLVRKNCKILASVKERTGCKILLALKGFAMWPLFPVIREYLDGVCASSPWEARLGRERIERSPNLFVAVSAFQLEEFGIEGAEAIRAGQFALLVAPDCGRFMLVWKALRVAMSGVREGRDYTLVTGRNVTVSMRRRTS